MTTHLVVIDDDPSIRLIFSRLLTPCGFTVHEAHSREKLRELLAKYPVQLVLLDLDLGVDDGLVIAREMKSTHEVAIIMVTAKSDEMDRVIGLELGADDYIVKPFSLREVVARVRAVLRRCSTTMAERGGEKVIRFGAWQIDLDGKLLKDEAGVPVPLTRAEYELLEALAARPGRLLSRAALLDLTKGPGAEVFDRSIDTLVGRLRKKIEVNSDAPVHIRTVRGMGYMFLRSA